MAAVVVLSLAGCGGSGTSVSEPAGQGIVTLGPATLTFNTMTTLTSVGSASESATLNNTGTASVSIGSVAIGGTNASDFTQTNTCGSTVAAGASCTVTVTFASPTPGAFTATLTVTSNATTGGSASVALSGTAAGQAAVTLGPAALTFNTVTSVTTTGSASQTATLTNTGNLPVTISVIALTGTNAGNYFTDTTNCGTTLPVGANCTITVTFSSGTLGTFTGSLVVTSTGSTGGSTSIGLSGTAAGQAAVTLGPATLTFSAASGSLSTAQAATLTNTGNLPVTISGISFTGANPTDFAETTTCGATLAVGANCTVSVTFSAAAAGTFTGSLVVANSASTGGSASVALTGTASAPVPLVQLSATSIAFATMTAGSTSPVQSVTVTNSGGAALALTSIQLSGTGAKLFNQTTTCGTSLAAGASCMISESFAPLVAGSYAATVTLTDNAGSGTQTISVSGAATPFVITINTSNASSWVINNGAITFEWNSTTSNLFSWVLDGHSDQLVDTTTTSNGQPDGLYMDNTGTFGSGSGTPACTVVGGTITGTGSTTCTVGTGSQPYVDWSTTVPSNSTNAYTFTEHWVVFPNDPGVHVYVELNHKTTDIAGSVGQVQWVFRDSLSTFTNTYEVNPSLTQLGVENIPQPPVADTASTDPGRAVQNAAEDLHGFNNLPAGFTREFYTKYDYAGYEYLHQGQGVYGTASSGTTYGVWTVLPRIDSFVGGPTKQDLYFTNNIEMVEAYSDHEDEPMNLNTAAGVAYNRVFGPYYYHVNTVGQAYNQTGNALQTPADMYADAIQAGAPFTTLYDNVAPLVAAGYTPSTARGSVSIQVNGVTGFGSQYTAWAVLSDPATNFQVSCNGYQYWQDISSTGTATFTGVVPGTYRLSVYVLGQWGELRQDNIVVTANQTTVVPATTWVPENFGTGTPVWTIGTADRSSHEFLHGHTANGGDDREFWGNWNYWADFAANKGAVIYNATSGPAGAATNNPLAWNYSHWGNSFDPGLYAGVYNSADDTTDGYNYAIPAYVAGLSTASGTNGVLTPLPPWQIHFATPASQTGTTAQSYVVLSVAIACAEGSYVVTLNGQQLIWHYTNASDCGVRSGLSGYTQWFAMQWPASVLNAVGQDNEIAISMSQTEGAEDDALRLELTNTSAQPSVRGWNDYTWISGSTTTLNNDAVPNP